jgi:peptide/nickel transport system substrate-binding protein
MRKHLCAAAALVLAIVIAGCGGSKGQSGSTVQYGSTASNGGSGSSKSYPELRWGAVTFPGPIDWTRNAWNQSTEIEALSVSNLMEFEPDGKIKPGVASSVEQPTPTAYVYHLKRLKFSDGKPLTAADVVYSLDRNIHSPEAWTKTYWEDVASVSARNSSTVVVRLTRPRLAFQDIVAFSGEIFEKAAAEKMSEKEFGLPGHFLIGTGPWKIDSYKPEVSVTLSRNPYWTGAPQPAEKITITFFKEEATLALALRSGAVDGNFYYLTPRIFANIPGVRRLIAPSASVDFVSANTDSPPFNDVHVRRALAYATNAQGIMTAIFPSGTATQDPTIVPADMFAGLGPANKVEAVLRALPKYAFNLEAAKRELAKSAYPHGFTTTIEVEQAATSLVSAAQTLASELAKIGINARVHELSPADSIEEVSGKTTLVVNETPAIYPDPESITSQMLFPSEIHPPGSGLNSANYRGAEFDKLIPESIESLNRPRRLEVIGKMLQVEGNEAPYWPLYSHATLGSLSTKYVLPTFSAWTWQFTPWALNVKLAHG